MRMRIVTYQSQLQLPTLIVAPVLLVAAVVVVIILVALILISINFLLVVVVVVLDTLCMLSALFGGANSQLPTPPVEYKLKYFAIRRHVRTRLNLAKD